mmetsp:Transcript_7250/g.30857  ORF Transcript_7250/g.30857 Transcript_7250/m.30857 type:complete len:312 (-) Transcript_7250:47-982(-)
MQEIAIKESLEAPQSDGRGATAAMDLFERESSEDGGPPADALSIAAETQAFCEHQWTTDPEYARFIVKAIRKGYFESAPSEPPIKRKEVGRRLLHLKRFYWRRVLAGMRPSEEYTDEFLLQHDRETAVISKILAQRRRDADTSSLLKPGARLALALGDNEHTLKMITLILDIAKTTDRLRKQVDAYKAITTPKGSGERRRQLGSIAETSKELAHLFGKMSRIQLRMREDKWRSKLSTYMEDKLNQLSRYGLSADRNDEDDEGEDGGQSDGEGPTSGSDEAPLVWFDRKGGLYQQLGDMVRSQFSWFPSSRL